jgi:hypothetical protein
MHTAHICTVSRHDPVLWVNTYKNASACIPLLSHKFLTNQPRLNIRTLLKYETPKHTYAIKMTGSSKHSHITYIKLVQIIISKIQATEIWTSFLTWWGHGEVTVRSYSKIHLDVLLLQLWRHDSGHMSLIMTSGWLSNGATVRSYRRCVQLGKLSMISGGSRRLNPILPHACLRSAYSNGWDLVMNDYFLSSGIYHRALVLVISFFTVIHIVDL